MWQEIIVGICVLAAAYFVLRQWLPFAKKKPTGCGGCGGTGSSNCSSAASTDSKSTGTGKHCDPSAR